jgi:TRAP transporter TAXI family solute receptor
MNTSAPESKRPKHISRRMLLAVLAVVPASMLTRAIAAQVRSRLVLATAGTGSAFLTFGQTLAAVLRRHAAIDIDIRETKGSNENAELVSAGEVAIACLNMGPGFDAWNGNPPFAGRRLRGMRALVPMYETPFHTIAMRARGIATLSDLDGRRVGVGPSGGPGEVFFKGVAEALGIRATLATGTPAEMAAGLLAGEIDAFWYGSGLPSPPFIEIAQKADAVVIGFTAPEADAFRRLFAYFAPFEIAANTYAGQTKPLASVAVWNFVVAHSAVPADLAHALTAALIGHADEVKASYPAAASMTIANLKADTFMPFHPGAVRYYRENGVTLPAELIPR